MFALYHTLLLDTSAPFCIYGAHLSIYLFYSIVYFCHLVLRDIYYILGAVGLGLVVLIWMSLLDCGFEGIDELLARDKEKECGIQEVEGGKVHLRELVMNDDMRFRVCMAFTSLR